MPSDTLPNGVMSNLALIATISSTTAVTIRLKSRLCATHRRMPRQFKIDMHMTAVGNLLAFSLLVIWAAYLPGDQNSRLELLVVMDILVGMHIQRYILRMIHCEDTAPYHAPGPLALARRVRRQKLALSLASITAASCAAMSVAVTYVGSAPYSHYSDTAEYLFIVVALPAIHSALRTIVLDMQGCKRQSVHAVPYDEGPTNAFTITDDDNSGDGGSADDNSGDGGSGDGGSGYGGSGEDDTIL